MLHWCSKHFQQWRTVSANLKLQIRTQFRSECCAKLVNGENWISQDLWRRILTPILVFNPQPMRGASWGRGLGTILLKTITKQVVKLEAGRMEWCALDKNVKVVKFYQALNVVVLPECRLCRLIGKTLQSCNLWSLLLCLSSLFWSSWLSLLCYSCQNSRILSSTNTLEIVPNDANIQLSNVHEHFQILKNKKNTK
jgi:hypothetical protein